MTVQNARNMDSGLAKAVPLLTSAWKVLGSNTGRKPNIVTAVYPSFHQHNQATAWTVTLLKLGMTTSYHQLFHSLSSDISALHNLTQINKTQTIKSIVIS